MFSTLALFQNSIGLHELTTYINHFILTIAAPPSNAGISRFIMNNVKVEANTESSFAPYADHNKIANSPLAIKAINGGKGTLVWIKKINPIPAKPAIGCTKNPKP